MKILSEILKFIAKFPSVDGGYQEAEAEVESVGEKSQEAEADAEANGDRCCITG